MLLGKRFFLFSILLSTQHDAMRHCTFPHYAIQNLGLDEVPKAPKEYPREVSHREYAIFEILQERIYSLDSVLENTFSLAPAAMLPFTVHSSFSSSKTQNIRAKNIILLTFNTTTINIAIITKHQNTQFLERVLLHLVLNTIFVLKFTSTRYSTVTYIKYE
jgi:hypothetical protein